jgi:type III secretion protein T
VNDLTTVQGTIIQLVLALPRFIAALGVSPFFGSQFIGGFSRQIIIIAIALVATPLVPLGAEPKFAGTGDAFYFVALLTKEVLIGVVIGLATGLPFWIAEGFGFFIDNQRGSSMAEMFNPMSETTTSPLGLLFTKVLDVVFFVGGGFHAFLNVMYDSFTLWPVFTPLPAISSRFPTACLALADHLVSSIVLFAGPVIFAMFLAEFGLGLINRFSPQLNVFFLAMPIKSAISDLLLIVYIYFLSSLFQKEFIDGDKLRAAFKVIFQ